MQKTILFVVVTFLLTLPVFAREKTDKIVLVNGDTLFVEAKELSTGSITCKTNSAGTIYIDWVDVQRLTSVYVYEVELQSGERFTGKLVEPSRDGLLAVESFIGVKEFPILDVFGMRPIGESWLARMDSDVSLGFSYTRSTSLADLTFGAGTVYNGPLWKTSVRLDSAFTVQGKSETKSQRHTFKLQPQRFFNRFLYTFGMVGFENNSQLDLDGRITTGAGPGIRVFRTEIQYLSFYTGLVFNEEWYDPSPSGQSSMEGVVGTTYYIFKKKSPKTSLSIDAQYFPGLTKAGRNRITGNVRLRQETVKDLFIELSSFVTYDSRQPDTVEASTDTGITTSIGYTF